MSSPLAPAPPGLRFLAVHWEGSDVVLTLYLIIHLSFVHHSPLPSVSRAVNFGHMSGTKSSQIIDCQLVHSRVLDRLSKVA